MISLIHPLPGSRLSDPFGWRDEIPSIGLPAQLHNGQDFAAGLGTPILAAHDGIVVWNGWDYGGGNGIQIQHAEGWSTIYFHMQSESPLEVGSRVSGGRTVIGLVGSTGKFTVGPHLHFMLRVNGADIDPVPYITTSIIGQKADDEMHSINMAGKHLFGVSNEFVTHYGDVEQAAITRQVTSATDEEHKLTVAQFNHLLDGLGIPRNVVRDGTVFNPQSGKFEKNGTWSRNREILAKLGAK